MIDLRVLNNATEHPVLSDRSSMDNGIKTRTQTFTSDLQPLVQDSLILQYTTDPNASYATMLG